jgi:hypothetical protein
VRVPVSDALKNSPSFISLGTVVKVLVKDDGEIELIKYPLPGVKLSIRSVDVNNVVLVEEHDEALTLLEMLTIVNPASLDAKTRECLRAFRANTGVMLNPLSSVSDRHSPEIPKGVCKIFWAYHRNIKKA